MKPMIAVDLTILGRVMVLGLMTFGLASCSYDRYLPPENKLVQERRLVVVISNVMQSLKGRMMNR